VVFLTGVARNLFMPLAATIAFALIMSFLVSRTVTPLLCLRYLHAEGHRPDAPGLGGHVSRQLDRLDDAYAAALHWVLGNRGKVIAGIGLAFLVSLGLFFRIGREFFPDTDESQFQITFRAPIGTRVEMTERVTERIEQSIRRALEPVKGADGRPVFNTIISNVGLPAGRTALFSANTGPHAGSVNVYLVPSIRRPLSDTQAADRVRQALRDAIPGTQTYFFIGGIVKRIQTFGTAAPVDVEIVGYDLEAGSRYAKLLTSRLRDLSDPRDGKPLLTDLQISREENYPELDVVVDREKAGLLGLSEQQVAQTVLTSLVGNTQFAPVPFTDYQTGNQYYINVRLDDRYRDQVSDVPEIFVKSPGGSVVNLANIAQVRRSSGPVLVNRKYLQRIIDVTANVAPGKDLGRASDAAQRALDDLPPPDGFTAQLGGQTAAQREANAGLLFAGLMAVALVYMILASQFRSLLDPLVIMFSVPLGISGVLLALWLTGTPLSVNSAMGVIMMVGIVVSNGVLLVDFARVLQGRGIPLLQATIQAGRTRLRPILMTTIATIFGLLPMALGFGEGSETNLPLARAVIGGLTVSTLFTLFLIPALYTLLDKFTRREPEAAPGAEVAK
jgi:multidrug efflux pump subunit AcrB